MYATVCDMHVIIYANVKPSLILDSRGYLQREMYTRLLYGALYTKTSHPSLDP